MERVAFRMKLKPGHADEYKKRHGQIWPELVSSLKDAGVSGYSIFFDEETNCLFAYLNVANATFLDDLPGQEIVRRWWQTLAGIMDINPDGSPVIAPLRELFYLP